MALPGGCSPHRAIRPVTLPLLDPVSQIVSELETIQEWTVIAEGIFANYPAVYASGLASLLAVCVRVGVRVLDLSVRTFSRIFGCNGRSVGLEGIAPQSDIAFETLVQRFLGICDVVCCVIRI